MFLSASDTQSGLTSVGYITNEVAATVIFIAARLNKPILLEGPPGSGKTELAYAVAKATGAEVERLQCFEGINEEKAIGKFDESLQRLYVELRARSGPIDWEMLKEDLHSERFFSAGPLLRSLQYGAAPCAGLCLFLTVAGSGQFGGDRQSATFKAEHSESEPRLVFFKPTSTQGVESNALITTKSGKEISLHLISAGQTAVNPRIDFLVEYRERESDNLEAVTRSYLFNCAEVKPFALTKLRVRGSLHPMHFQKKMP